MTFSELQQMVADDMQYQAQPKPGVQDRIRRYLNEGLERVLRRPRLKQLRLGFSSIITRAESDGTGRPLSGFFGVPDMLERIDYVMDPTGRTLPMRSREWYRTQHDPNAVGTPSVWIPEGVGPVIRQPRYDAATNSTPLWVSSQSTLDTTQIVRIRVSYHVGNQFEIETQLNGTTPVDFGGVFANVGEATISMITIDSLTRAFVFINDVQTPGSQPADMALAYITPWNYTTRHIQIRLYPAPSTPWLIYRIEGQRVIPRMTHDEDEPPFSADFHEMLACYARGRFYRKDGRMVQSQQEMAEFERYCLDLTAHVEYPVGYKPVAGKLSSSGGGWSDLGSWYPADRIVS